MLIWVTLAIAMLVVAAGVWLFFSRHVDWGGWIVVAAVGFAAIGSTALHDFQRGASSPTFTETTVNLEALNDDEFIEKEPTLLGSRIVYVVVDEEGWLDERWADAADAKVRVKPESPATLTVRTPTYGPGVFFPLEQVGEPEYLFTIPRR